MSLIVARVTDNGQICIVSDTAITYRTTSQNVPLVEGCLKLYRLSKSVAVAFAGSVASFSALWPEIRDLRSTSDIAQAAVLHFSRNSDFELLVAEAGTQKITFVKGGILAETTAGFLGDSVAYGYFQNLFHNPQTQQPLEIDGSRATFQIVRVPEPSSTCKSYIRMYYAMRDVIVSPAFPSVGGILIPLCTDQGEFRYMNYVDILSDHLHFDDFTDEPKAISFGTAAGGAYSIDFSDDRPLGGEGSNIGLFILQGGFGVTFLPAKSGLLEAQLVRATNPALWSLETSRVLGHGIASSFASLDHCIQAGEEFIVKEQYADAVFCYELRKDSAEKELRPLVIERYFLGYAFALSLSGRNEMAIDVLEARFLAKGLSDISNQFLEHIKLGGDPRNCLTFAEGPPET